jgi:hypothetical protein
MCRTFDDEIGNPFYAARASRFEDVTFGTFSNPMRDDNDQKSTEGSGLQVGSMPFADDLDEILTRAEFVFNQNGAKSFALETLDPVRRCQNGARGHPKPFCGWRFSSFVRRVCRKWRAELTARILSDGLS